ncbi:hypothetical protein T492DRAFT_876340 [Pavlovales sp. CCMP2436]|nr:hypothetical protein T492DRAFT_876340 [Pavlovales sp. CCMP2436]
MKGAIYAENVLPVLRMASQHACVRLKACLAFLLKHLPEMVAKDTAELDEQTVEGMLALLHDKLVEPLQPEPPPAKRAKTSGSSSS